MSTIHIDVVSAEELLFEGEAQFVSLPGEMGSLGIKPGHIPLITKIKPGTVDIQLSNGENFSIYVNGGILEVQPNRITVLSDTAIRAKDLDEKKALEAKRVAEEAMKNRQSNTNLASIQAEFAAAAAQLAAIQKLRKRK